MNTCLFLVASLLAPSYGHFAYDLYENTIHETNENVIISPLSVHSSLTLAYMGAAGQTADDMARVLRFPSNHKIDVSDAYHKRINEIIKGPSIKLATKVFVSDFVTLKPSFVETAQKKFYSSAQTLDFKSGKQAADTINEWVTMETSGKIHNLVNPASINADTRAIIANAIYFKGFWTYRFDKEETRKFPFWVGGADEEIKEVDMMHVKAKYKYGHFNDLDAVGCELTCKNSHISMLILLPNQRNGLHKIEANLRNIDFAELSNKMVSQEVVVFLPKFKIEFTINLNKELKKMGLASIFNLNANFTEMVESEEPLFISDVVHKAFIEVTEEGAEAAGATTALLMKRVMPMYPYFVAEHPFLFVLKDVDTHEIVFIGRFKQPKDITE